MLKKFINSLRGILLIFIDSLFFLKSLKKKKEGLVIIKIDAIGDFMILSLFCKQILEKYKKNNEDAILICNKVVEDFALEQGLFDNVLSIDVKKFRNNFFYRSKNIRNFRKINTRIAFQPTISRDLLSGDAIMRALNSKSKIGIDGDFYNRTIIDKLIGDNFYSKLVKVPPNSHESEIYNSLITSNAIKELSINSFSKVKKLDLIKSREKEKIVIICPGASTHKRIWPYQNYQKILKWLIENTKYKIIICGSKNEKKLSKLITSNYSNERIINKCGVIDLKEFIEIISYSKLVICNDSAAAHISVKTATDCICIVGGGHYKRFLPYPNKLLKSMQWVIDLNLSCFYCNWNCKINHFKNAPYPCINDIDSDKVINILGNYFSEK